eukprot:927943-Rhodomonas_salina.1
MAGRDFRPSPPFAFKLPGTLPGPVRSESRSRTRSFVTHASPLGAATGVNPLALSACCLLTLPAARSLPGFKLPAALPAFKFKLAASDPGLSFLGLTVPVPAS